MMALAVVHNPFLTFLGCPPSALKSGMMINGEQQIRVRCLPHHYQWNSFANDILGVLLTGDIE
jgi:hypothetical protein